MQLTKRTFLTFILLSFTISLFPQSTKDIEANKREMNKIRQSGEQYTSAIGDGETLSEAYENAYRNLAMNIYTEVRSTTSTTVSTTQSNGNLEGETTFSNQSEITTNLQISGTALIIGKPGVPNKKNNKYSVFVYIESSLADQIRAEKMQDVADKKKEQKEAELREEEALQREIDFYYRQGIYNLEKLSIGNALKSFFSGYVLSTGTYAKIEDGPADIVFANLIEQVLDNITVICEDNQFYEVNKSQKLFKKKLMFYYTVGEIRKKLDGLNFDYNDGYKYTSGATVRNGESEAILKKDSRTFKLECRIYEPSELEPHVTEAIKGKTFRDFKSAEKTVDCKFYERDDDEATEVLYSIEEDTNPAKSLLQTYDSTRYNDLAFVMEEIKTAIETKKYEPVEKYFTENGWSCFDRLVNYGHATVVSCPDYFDFIPFDSLLICRSIALQFNFKNNKKFVENVVFRFNMDDRIESLAFALTDVAQRDIVDNDDWKREEKLALLNFMEDYQTAYALKRIDYLEQIFSDNALIISGYKVYQKIGGDHMRFKNSIKYDTLSKAQYISRLRTQFKTKEYINLNFTETEFDQAPRQKGLFGIRVRQEYFSNTYGDVGYLFLAVDLRGKQPTIHVRAWQEDKLPLDKLFSLKDLRR